MSTDKLAQALRDMGARYGLTDLAAEALAAHSADPPLNLSDRAVQKRLAAQWGFVEAEQAQAAEPVAQVVSSGPANFPILQWVSAEHSFNTPIGSKLFATPRTLSPAEIDRIHDSIECWNGYGLGAKFNHQAFARAVLAATGGATPPVAKEPT